MMNGEMRFLFLFLFLFSIQKQVIENKRKKDDIERKNVSRFIIFNNYCSRNKKKKKEKKRERENTCD